MPRLVLSLSANALSGLWQLAQLIFSSLESLGSKKSSRPRSILSRVGELSFGEGAGGIPRRGEGLRNLVSPFADRDWFNGLFGTSSKNGKRLLEALTSPPTPLWRGCEGSRVWKRPCTGMQMLAIKFPHSGAANSRRIGSTKHATLPAIAKPLVFANSCREIIGQPDSS